MGWRTMPDGTVVRTPSFEESMARLPDPIREARAAWDEGVDNSGHLTAPGDHPVVDECRGCGRHGCGPYCYRCQTGSW